MNTLRVALFSLGLLAASSAMAQDKLRVLDQGLDGNQRTYTITCPDGKLSTVVEQFDFDAGKKEEVSADVVKARIGVKRIRPPSIVKVCVFPHSGKERCRQRWPLDSAAAASCK